MPIYEYGCNFCGVKTEILHGMNDTPELRCTCGSGDITKLMSACGFKMRDTHAINQARDTKKSDSDMKQELKEDHLVHNFTPIGKNGVSDVHQDVKSQGSFVRDKMQEEVEKNSNKTKAKQNEWMKKAMKRAPERSREIVKRKKKKESEGRKITVTS